VPRAASLCRGAANLLHMRETLGPPLKAAALVAFLTGLGLTLLNPFSLGRVFGLLTLLAGIVAVVLIAGWVAVLLGRNGMPEQEFRRISERSEKLAKLPPTKQPLSEFDEQVVAAIDDLPEEFDEVLEEIPILISHLGHEHRAYGHYIGDTVARDNYRDHIVIYQDTLERDFGHDPDLLRAQIERTVRHEVAHHLGWNEQGVRNLGL
jgi:predicted Zn-dependent protease with MMP-like domain